jgi:glycosyltransferase involved in cell wall biosynthesis
MTEKIPTGQADAQPDLSHTLLPFESGAASIFRVEREGLYRRIESANGIDLTLFVACYNEEQNIVATLDTVVETLRELPLTYEVIVVDDGSRDRSWELLLEYQKQHPALALVLVRNVVNCGLARNFAEAAFLGRGRYYKLLCGDNVESSETLKAVFAQVGKADLVIPYHKNIVGRSWLRRFLSRTYTRLVNLLSGQSLRYYNGCGLYRRVDVMRWHSRSSGFGFQAELVTQLLAEGAAYIEVPITAMERQNGSSTALRLRNWISVGCSLLNIFLCRVGAKRPHRVAAAPLGADQRKAA